MKKLVAWTMKSVGLMALFAAAFNIGTASTATWYQPQVPEK